MEESRDRHVAFVRQVNDDLKAFVENLARDNDRLTVELARTSQERAELQRKVHCLKTELAAHDAEHAELMRLVQGIRSDNSDLHTRLTEVMEQTNDLTNLYVASHQLHSAQGAAEVLEALHDIVINIVGSEEFTIMVRLGGNGTLTQVQSYGIPTDQLQGVEVDDGDPVGQSLQSGELYLYNQNGAGPRTWQGRSVLACIPLRLGEHTTGAIVIFSLLPQKAALGPGDVELFELLGNQAAGALHLARLTGSVAS